MYASLQAPYRFDYYSFTVWFEIRVHYFYSFVLKIILVIEVTRGFTQILELFVLVL